MVSMLLGSCFACGGSDTDPVTDPPEVQGIQIGSEGIISDACTTESVQSDQVVEGFSAAAKDLTDAVLGAIEGVFTTASSETARGALTLRAESWSKVRGEGCPEQLLVELSGSLMSDPLLSAELVGWGLLDPNGRMELVMWGSHWTGSVQPTLVEADFDSLELRVDAEIDPGLRAQVSFEGCAKGVCETEPAGRFQGR